MVFLPKCFGFTPIGAAFLGTLMAGHILSGI